jgi:toxin ParE1/3/4
VRSFVISPRAARDLDEIWDYTYETWGRHQADAYVAGMKSACQSRCEPTKRGIEIDEIRAGYLKYIVGSHFLIFRIINDRINIIRVLHESMDFKRHLK